ncbi:uncharacterized protein [Oscarella lobularis]|uniref:uncharacterized protein n=1 Tax=Oscarella lobularis TaxID=121494 RepID=UPI00331403B0
MIARAVFLLLMLLGIFAGVDAKKKGSFLRCWRVRKVATAGLLGSSSCFYYVRSSPVKWGNLTKWPLSNVYQEFNSADLFGSKVPHNVWCTWRFDLKENHNALVGCTSLHLDVKEDDCNLGYCHPCTSPYTNSRDFMRVVLAKNSKCRGSDRNGRSSCTRCYYNRLHWQCGECTLRENRCAHLGQESCDSNHVFCGKSDKGVQVKVRYCETRKGVVEVDFVADETRRTKMFRCSFVDLNEVCLWRPVYQEELLDYLQDCKNESKSDFSVVDCDLVKNSKPVSPWDFHDGDEEEKHLATETLTTIAPVTPPGPNPSHPSFTEFPPKVTETTSNEGTE